MPENHSLLGDKPGFTGEETPQSKEKETKEEKNIYLDPVDCEDINYVKYVKLCQEGDFFPQFYPMHNHDDYKVTNTNTLANPVTSMYPSGQLTFIQMDAPTGRLRFI